MIRDYQDYLSDICEMNDIILEFMNGSSYETFIQDQRTQFAVIRTFEIMGEASKNVPAKVREQYPEIPWVEMAGMRDKLIHGYFGVDLQIIYKTAVQILPDLQQICRKMITEQIYETK
jgi:uncharacterized protein with HEPN domain